MIGIPSQLDAQIDLALAALAVALAAPLWWWAGRLRAGPALGIRYAVAGTAWASAWVLAAPLVPTPVGLAGFVSVILLGAVTGAPALVAAIRAAWGNPAEQMALAPSVALGTGLLGLWLGSAPIGFQWASASERLAFLEGGEIPILAAADLGTTGAPLVRLSSGGCRDGIQVSWTERSRNSPKKQVRYAIVDSDWDENRAVAAWTASCTGPWDLVALHERVDGRLADEARLWKRASNAVVVSATSAGALTADLIAASRWFRGQLALALLAGLAASRRSPRSTTPPATPQLEPEPSPASTGNPLKKPVGPGFPRPRPRR